jgi:hypothetical protein
LVNWGACKFVIEKSEREREKRREEKVCVE